MKACIGVNPAIFFPDRPDHAALRKAGKVCASCPMRTQCREEYAAEEYGVFGGVYRNREHGVYRDLVAEAVAA